MKIALRVIGVLLLLMGPIWFLQGANVLTAGNSPMIGDRRWEFYGALAALIGAVVKSQVACKSLEALGILHLHVTRQLLLSLPAP